MSEKKKIKKLAVKQTSLDSQLRLSDEDSAKICQWFNEKMANNARCQVCHANSWFNHNYLYTPIVFNLAMNVHTRTVIRPTAIVECSNCGKLSLFF